MSIFRVINFIEYDLKYYVRTCIIILLLLLLYYYYIIIIITHDI